MSELVTSDDKTSNDEKSSGLEKVCIIEKKSLFRTIIYFFYLQVGSNVERRIIQNS